MSRDRRRSPRVEILGRLHGHAVSLDLPLAVREVSLGGMSMVTAMPFPVGAIHEFSLTLGDGAAVNLNGRVVYSRELSTPDGELRFVSGIEFVTDGGDAPAVRDTVDDVL